MSVLVSIPSFLSDAASGLIQQSYGVSTASDSDQIYCTKDGACSLDSCSSYNSCYCYTNYSTCSCYTYVPAPTFDIWASATHNSITVYVDWKNTTVTLINYYLNNSYIETVGYSGFTITKDADGNPIRPNTTYQVKAAFYKSEGNRVGTAGNISVTTSSSPLEQFDWNANTERKAAYAAITGNGLFSKLTATVWNDIVDKTVELLDYRKMSWRSTYASYYNTLASSGGTLTAAMFNSLVCNVEYATGSSSGIGTVYKGGVIYGWYFTSLVLCINNYIVNL